MLDTERTHVVPVSQTSTLIDVLRWRAYHQPEQRAYTFLEDGETTESTLSYGELDRQARVIGATLQHLGASGARVVLLYPAGLEYIAAFFGCLYAGATAVPAYPPRMHQSLDRLQTMVTDAQATMALTTTTLLSKAQQWSRQEPGLKTLRWLATEYLTAGLADTWQAPAIDSQTLAFLQYTSGSTGTPKGVMLSHANLLHNEGMIQTAFQHTERSLVVGWLPLYHDMGLIGNVLQPLYVGCPCVLMSPMAFLQRPSRWLKAVSRYQATTSGGPNFAYDLCVRKITPAQRAELDLSTWDVAFNGAEPVRPETLDRFVEAFAPCGFRRQAFYPCYGLAEASLIVSGGQKEALPVVQTVQRSALEQYHTIVVSTASEDVQALVGCGQTLLGQEIVIVDPATCTPCLADQVGEIWVTGPSVAQGYWGRPAATAETCGARLAGTGDERTFLRTGDLGFLYDGELFVTGRLKDVMIIRGCNYYPQDIETTVTRCHPSLRPGCGAAFTIDMDGEERLVVVHEVERRTQLQPAHRPERRQCDVEPGYDPASPVLFEAQIIIDHMRQAVAEQHGLQLYAALLLRTGSIPKTSSGKLQRYACRARFLTHSLEVISSWHTPVVPLHGLHAAPVNCYENLVPPTERYNHEPCWSVPEPLPCLSAA